MHRKGYIYCIADESSRFKLGLSQDADIRLDILQVGNAELLTIKHRIEVIDMKRAETGLHGVFSADYIRGEWYGVKDIELLQKIFREVATDKREEKLLESLGLR